MLNIFLFFQIKMSSYLTCSRTNKANKVEGILIGHEASVDVESPRSDCLPEIRETHHTQ